MDKIESVYNSVLHSFEEVPDLDLREFLALKRDTNEEVVLKILARFRMTLTECLNNIDEGFKQGKTEMIWQAAHKIAGSAQLLGFRNLGVEARDLYIKLKNEISDTNEASREIQDFMRYGAMILQTIELKFPQHSDFL